ncbi:carboxypeptidase regulatory-like domain-containing protein [Candidatus Bathyarchaeota archaeon]|nr:carboxypeptidase regulatory-like domain-containing protein [Candidatus Bathyarchaeota archaeon]
MRSKILTPIFFSLILCLALIVPAYAQVLTVTTDKDVYGPGETIKVSGTAVPNSDVTVQIFNPALQLVDIDVIRAEADGKYTLSFKIPEKIPTGLWTYGTYLVKAYMAGQVATKTIEIRLAVTVVGKVVDKAGVPIPDADVIIGPASGKTLSDGTFTIGLPAEGTYTVKISKAGYYSYTGTVAAAIGTNNLGTITLVSYEDKIAELEKKISDLERSLSGAAADISALKTQLAPLSKNVDALSKDVSDLKTKTDSLSKDLSALKSDLEALKTQVRVITDIQSAVRDLRSSVDDLKTAVGGLSGPIAQLPILYALAIVAIIIAIIAIILTYRKIVK